MLVLLILLLLVCAVAPWLGTDTSDSRSQEARPEMGWYPAIRER